MKVARSNDIGESRKQISFEFIRYYKWQNVNRFLCYYACSIEKLLLTTVQMITDLLENDNWFTGKW